MRATNAKVFRRWAVRLLWLALYVTLCAPAVFAGVPRFISGASWGVPQGWSVIWPRTTVLYFTDPGALGPGVSHAEADAMVAAAAHVWNVPAANITLAAGGQLQEDVSLANTTFDGQRVVFPQDVQISSEAAVPVAIVYDATGEIIDLLLGAGASEPDGCRQNAVVGDIDDIHQNDGTLRHATLILNGRCVGSTPEQLTQMQYQLARAFGRILGVSWSQTNDNVFTGQTTVTADQVAHWPLMHPLDVLCGTYSYQCMSNPFTLRDEDVNTLAFLYPVPMSSVPSGKIGSSNDAVYLWGILYFPSGPGMGWTNVTVHRLNNGVTEDWQTTSSVTGYDYLQSGPTPLQPVAPTSTGNSSPGLDGYFAFRRIPADGVSNLYFTSEAINPLYTGDASVGPYIRPPATPSGSPATFVDWSAFSYGDNEVSGFLTASDATATCTSPTGTEQQPASLDPTGWETGALCAWGTNAWWSLDMPAGHSWTVEVTATDETGAATGNKLQPVLGLWRSSDAAGTLPTQGSQPVPFNALSLGVTQFRGSAAAVAQRLRLSLSDQFGAGRPDFTYVTRLLYAGAVTPSSVPAAGGQLTITGTGFRQGMRVLLNGSPTTVMSVTATQLVVQAPPMTVAGAQAGQALDLLLSDRLTGGTTGITRAVRYVQLPDLLTIVSAPTVLKTGLPAAQPLTLRVVSADGVTPVAGSAVTLAVSAGDATLGACGTGCTLLTDAQGLVQVPVTGLAAGSIKITVTQANGAGLVFGAIDTDPVRSVGFNLGAIYLAQGASVSLQLGASLLQEGSAIADIPVAWSASAGLTLQATQSTSTADGVAGMGLTVAANTPPGEHTVTACAWVTLCSTWTLTVVPPSQWRFAPLATLSGEAVAGGAARQLSLAVTDEAGHVLQGAPVYVYQRILAATPPCAAGDRCATAAVLSSSQTTLTSDSGGQVAFTQLALPGIPQTLQVAAATGTDGFTTFSAASSPAGN